MRRGGAVYSLRCLGAAAVAAAAVAVVVLSPVGVVQPLPHVVLGGGLRRRRWDHRVGRDRAGA